MAKEPPMWLTFEVGVLGSIGNGRAWGITGICHVEYKVMGSIHDKGEEGRDYDTAESAKDL